MQSSFVPFGRIRSSSGPNAPGVRRGPRILRVDSNE